MFSGRRAWTLFDLWKGRLPVRDNPLPFGCLYSSKLACKPLNTQAMIKMQLVFLGTSSMIPTKERNHSGLFLSYKNEGILFDCGEGMQRQLRAADIKPTKITKIIISHWHGDHVLGLMGLLQTMGAMGYDKVLKIYGPKGTTAKITKLFEIYPHDKKLEFEVHDIKEGTFLDKKEYSIEARALDHTAYCLGYRFVEKDKRKIDMAKVKGLGMREGPLLGKLQDNKTIIFREKTIKPDDASYVVPGRVIAIITDTQPCTNALRLAQDADLIVCEATYLSNLEEKSESHGHMTSKQAASLASHANAKKLVLTHFSQRYKTTDELLEDAKTYFRNVACAYDFMKWKV